MPYVKLDSGILDSSLWVEDAEVRIVFITILAMCGPDGLCEATAPGIARRANLPIDAVRRALAVLEAPDPDSRTKDDGRRIERVDGGYYVLNYLRYREKDHTAAGRMRRYRQRKRDVTLRPVTQAEAEAEAKAEANTKKGKAFTPPLLSMVLEYAQERGQALSLAHRFYDYFTAGEWKDAKGNPVRNWKQKFITWEKHEPPRPAEVKENPEVRALYEELRSRGQL